MTIDTVASMSAPPALRTADRATPMMRGIPPTTSTVTSGARITHCPAAVTSGPADALAIR